MDKQRTTQATIIFAGLALAGVTMAVIGLDQASESVQATLIALGAAIFGAGLAFFLVTARMSAPTMQFGEANARPTSKAVAIFCALAIAGTGMAALSPMLPVASVQNILIPVGASLLSAGIVFFLLEAFDFSPHPAA